MSDIAEGLRDTFNKVVSAPVNAVSGAVDAVKKATGFGPPTTDSPSKPDNSWHSDMVKQANDSFAKQQSKPASKPNTTVKPGKTPSYKHGTDYVPKTGLAKLHKGEAVLPKDEAEQHRQEKRMSHTHTDTVQLSHHRVVMHLHKGGLHRALGVPEGTVIPKEKIEAAKNSKNPHVAKMAELAHTMASWKH
jgi:hypothetical protein